MSFTTTFLPIVGMGAGLFCCGLLFQGYRFLDLVVTGLIRKP
jgi:hypothetical protein